MDTGGDRGERGEIDGGGSGISRRHFLAGGMITIGSTSVLFERATSARFADTNSASGTIRLSGFPKLDYTLIDQTEHSNAEYRVAYQVDNVSNFDRMEVHISNITNGSETWDRTITTQEGTFDFPFGGGHLGGHEGDTFEFNFRVFETGNTDPVIEETVTDEADGEGSGDGDFSTPDSPDLDWLIVEDSSENGSATFTVYYEISKLDNFGGVKATFKDTTTPGDTRTDTSANSPNGVLHYNRGGAYGDSFDILVEVENQNGLVVDSRTVTTSANGSDPNWVGNPARSDSPEIASFTVTDNTDNSGAKFLVDYSIENTTRLGGVLVHFDNLGKDSADRTYENDPGEQSTMTYSRGGAGGYTYHITVEALETRNGVTFPIDSGTVEDVAGGNDSPTEYPADSI